MCNHWAYRYPDDMGVCTHPSGPSNDLRGFAVPIKSAVLSASTKTAHPGKIATSNDTVCGQWEPEP